MDDKRLIEIARQAIDGYRYGTELAYFLGDDSSEQEPVLMILRAVAAAAIEEMKAKDKPPEEGFEAQLKWLREELGALCSRFETRTCLVVVGIAVDARLRPKLFSGTDCQLRRLLDPQYSISVSVCPVTSWDHSGRWP